MSARALPPGRLPPTRRAELAGHRQRTTFIVEPFKRPSRTLRHRLSVVGCHFVLVTLH